MIQKALSWSTSTSNTFAAHALMLARDPVALAGTGAPVVLVVCGKDASSELCALVAVSLYLLGLFVLVIAAS